VSGYLLDTHTLLWWLDNPEKLTQAARNAISDADHDVYVSAAAGWEIGIKQALGNLTAPDSLLEVVRDSGIEVLPITFEHGLSVKDLPPHHQDPFDRVMVAQAAAEGLVLVTRDTYIHKYDVATLKA